MSKKQPKFNPTRHPRDPFYDKTRIRIVERYKTSGLSGDEWRFSFVVEIFRKGTLVASKTVNDMEYAAVMLAAAVHMDLDELGHDGWDVLEWEQIPNAGICCQPGCSKKATRKYVMKELFDRSCSFNKPNKPLLERIYGREFCDAHGERGDCGLDDANRNYICIEGKDWNDAPIDPAKVRESVFGGVEVEIE